MNSTKTILTEFKHRSGKNVAPVSYAHIDIGKSPNKQEKRIIFLFRFSVKIPCLKK